MHFFDDESYSLLVLKGRLLQFLTPLPSDPGKLLGDKISHLLKEAETQGGGDIGAW